MAIFGESREELVEYLKQHGPKCQDCGADFSIRDRELAAFASDENLTIVEALHQMAKTNAKLIQRFGKPDPVVPWACPKCCDEFWAQKREEEEAESVAKMYVRTRMLKLELAGTGLWPEQYLLQTFENSRADVEAKNADAWKAIREWTPKKDNLWLEGTTGTGKTYAACCVANRELARGHRVAIVSGSTLNLVSYRDFEKKVNMYSRPMLLILDDLHAPTWTPTGVSVLHELLNNRHQSAKSNVYVSNMSVSGVVARIRTGDDGNKALTSAISERMMKFKGGVQRLSFKGESLRRETST